MQHKYSPKLEQILLFQNFRNFKWRSTNIGAITLSLVILLWQGFRQRETFLIKDVAYTLPLLIIGETLDSSADTNYFCK